MSDQRKVDKVCRDEILRLARKAGIGRLSGLMYDEVRSEIVSFLDGLLKAVVVFVNINRRNTLMEQDVVSALKEMGIQQTGLPLRGRCPIYNSRRLTNGNHISHLQRGGDSESIQEGGAKSRRFHPGTVARRQIKYYQSKSGCVVLRKSIIQRVIRDIVMNHVSEIKISEPAMLLIHSTLEVHLSKLLNAAREVANQNKRPTVQVDDFQLVKRILRN